MEPLIDSRFELNGEPWCRGPFDESLERGHETEIVEGARTELDRQAADVLEGLDRDLS